MDKTSWYLCFYKYVSAGKEPAPLFLQGRLILIYGSRAALRNGFGFFHFSRFTREY